VSEEALVGTCHCGRVRITLRRAPEAITQCNCSLCSRTGFQGIYYGSSELRIDGETEGRQTMTDRPIRSTRLLQRALAIAMTQRLYVFPVTPRGKTPAVRGWQELATRDPDRIRAWFEAASYNIGISTGPSNLLVVDLDDGHGALPPEPWLGARHGKEVLARLAAAAGENLPTNTYTVTTPTGGLHLYFRQPEEISLRNSVGTLGWRIDTRGNGGYIVAAGPRRPEGFYRVANPAPIAPLPNWLRDALTPPRSSRGRSVGRGLLGAIHASRPPSNERR